MVYGYDKELFTRYGLAIPIDLGIAAYPHMLCTGASGSGKTQALLFLLGKLLQSCPDNALYVCDFKKSRDFSFLGGYPYYYAGQSCYDGIMEYYKTFSYIRENPDSDSGKRFLLVCDEYPALINYLQMRDKMNKTSLANDILSAVSEILMLGRGTGSGFGVWIITQRPDSTLFKNGARDNFMVIIGLGRMSKEQKGMVFTGQDIPDELLTVGEGLLLADGKEIKTVKYPLIRDAADWKNHILSILMKNCE